MDRLISDAIQHSLKRLGYTTIRQHQQDILEKLLRGQDCLLVAPTGSGKSFIFEAAPFAFSYLNSKTGCSKQGNMVVVVSPLISLMRLQARKLQERNIHAAYLQDLDDPSYTEHDHKTEITNKDNARLTDLQIVLASPESLLGQYRQQITDLADSKHIAALVVDEAHCVLKYGFSRKTKSGKRKKAFRPAYSRLLELRAIMGEVPLVALTATLTVHSKEKLIKQLNMSPCFIIDLPPKKDNIKYIVHRFDNDTDLESSFEWLKDMVATQGEKMLKTLVFFHKVAKQSLVYEFLDDELKESGHKGKGPFSDKTHFFEMYHMKTDDSIKQSVLEHFSGNGHLRCVLASSSFSMGLDIPDVERIVHFGPAMDVDDFLQETGRASRSVGSKALSIVLLSRGCLNGPNLAQEMKKFVKTKNCRRVAVLKHYMDNAESIKPQHDCCDNCSDLCKCGDCPESPLVQLGITEKNNTVSDGDSQDGSNTSDNDSDMEVFRRKPEIVLSDSD